MSEQKKYLDPANEKFSGKQAFGFAMTRASSILSSLLIGEITYFGTNSLGLAAAAIASGMTIKTIIDSITDLFMGAVIDRTHSKWGKARPYSLAGVMVWLCILAIFCVPTGLFASMADGTRQTVLVIYITVFGTLASAIFETMRGVAFTPHLRRSIANDANRVKVMTIGGVIYSVGSLGMQAALPMIIEAFHGSQKGFEIMAVILGIMGIVASIACFFCCKEYSDEELAAFQGVEPEVESDKIGVIQFLKSLKNNKYIWMWTIINFMAMLNLMGAFSVGQYYFQYVFGDLGAFTIVMASSAAAFPIMFFIPKLCNRFGVVRLLSWSTLMAIAGVVLRMVFPGNLLVQCIGYLCFSMPNIPFAFVGSQVTIECIEYGMYSSGVSVEAMYSSFISFAQKMSGSLSSVILGVVLTLTGFDALTKAVLDGGFIDWAELASLGEAGFEQYVAGGAATVQNAMQGISLLYNVIPLICLVILVVLIHFFRLEEDLKKLRQENAR